MDACDPTRPAGVQWSMKVLFMSVAVACGMIAPSPAGAQMLLNRYSFRGNANDSVGGAHGTVIGSVTFQTDRNQANGHAVFAGGTSGGSPGYIRLPAGIMTALQNVTFEIFTTNFNMPKDAYGLPGGQFQALFGMGSLYGNQGNYLVLSPNRAGAGIGVGARRNNVAETVTASLDPLPVWRQNHVVHLVYSGFTGLGTTGTVAIYLDGVRVAQGTTVNSPAYVAAGTGGTPVVGIGGGSPWNDPTFNGSMTEFRIFDGALTTAQISANVAAGPATLGFTPVVPPYTVVEAARALQIAAGLGLPATSREIARLNVEPDSPSPAVTMRDAVRLARKAADVDVNP